MPLNEQRRSQLDQIVQQAIANKEADATIKTIVGDFKGKYDNEGTVESSPTYKPSFLEKLQGGSEKVADTFGYGNLARGIGSTGRILAAKATGKPLPTDESAPTNRQIVGGTLGLGNVLATLAALASGQPSPALGTVSKLAAGTKAAKVVDPVVKFLSGGTGNKVVNAAGKYAGNSLNAAPFVAGQSLSENKSNTEIAKDVATKAPIAGAVTGIIGGAGALFGKVVSGSAEKLVNRFYKTDKKTFKYLDKTVPQILEEKKLFGKKPQEVFDFLKDEQSKIGQQIGEFDKSAKGLTAKINTQGIKTKLEQLAQKFDTPTSQELKKQVQGFAEAFDGEDISVGEAVELYRKYNGMIGGKFGKDSPPATLEANIAIRGSLMEELNKIADKIPEFKPLNKSYAETTAALNAADNLLYKQANQTSFSTFDALSGSAGAISALINPATAIPTAALFGAKKALDNPQITTGVAKGVKAITKFKPVNNQLTKLLLNLGLGKGL